ncbi:MAG: penicillin-binding protein 2 [Caulobacter sp.]|nr:penicillin-binding protein 2 [Caulobacter sp.]
MSLANLSPHRYPRVIRWAIDWLWKIEHAFERAKASGRPEDDARVRILVVLVFFAVLFGMIGGGAIFAAVFSDAGKHRGGGSLPLTAKADLVDRNGQLLAVNLTHYSLFLDPADVWNRAETRKALLTRVPGLKASKFNDVMDGRKRRVLVEGLTPDVRDSIHDLGLPGISFEETPRRIYPMGPLAAHLVGFADPWGKGLQGAERGLQDQLRDGYLNNQPVALSIDVRVQAALEEELANAVAEFHPKGAVGLVTNIHTGEIIAMASLPEFDPNRASKFSEDERKNRATAQLYEMGSTFKAFTVAIGLDTGIANLDSTYDARTPLKMGYRTIHDYHGTNRILTLGEVFNHSSNIGTAKLALGIGVDKLKSYYDALGLTRRPQLEIFETAQPLTPRDWNDDALASVSFGHGINVTPLALAQAMGCLLNGGTLVPLTILKRPTGYQGEAPRVVSVDTSRAMLKIMRGNVVEGTGRKADAIGLSVGGKTGTGEKYDPAIRGYSNTRQVASFAAVFPTEGPIEAPRYFVLVLLDEPTGGARTGGLVAAPAVGRVIDRSARFLGVPRQMERTQFDIAAVRPRPAL